MLVWTQEGIIKRIDIYEQPAIVDQSSKLGDLEVDLIIGKNHKQAILTINDRAYDMLNMRKVNNKKEMHVSKAIVTEIKNWLPYINTITSDNRK